MNALRMLVLLPCALLASCKLGPDYVRPEVETPAAWRMEYPQAADAANTKWWEQFGDTALNGLLEDALRGNLEIRAAAARVDQLLGALATTRSQFFPQLGYYGDASRNRASQRGPTALPAGVDPTYSLYEGALTASWQIDLFGRVRRQAEAIQAQVYASEQGRRGLVLSIASATVASYIGLRALDRQLEIAQATAKNYADSVHLFELRFKRGAVSEVELRQVESQYYQAMAAIPSLEQSIAAQENLISILLGRNPGPIPRGLALDQIQPPAIPAGLPSDLLRRRPDILQAEQNLVAANAGIGAAKALYFPTISLTGSFGSVSTAFSDFLTGPSRAWAVGADLAGPIFTFGGIEGQVRSAESARDEALLVYRQTILAAFQQTNDALVGAQKKNMEVEALVKRVQALRDYARLSRRRFDNGTASYIEVLYAENELFGAELNSVNTQAERFSQIINVYKAMGGGWVDVGAEIAAPKPPEGK
ncbi:MAG TPA: efflux transporter outer membrane subunit [Burkholderiales bacterium]|nr:efflux transporter outer membrane subunit [Burkholderiales bacterium]